MRVRYVGTGKNIPANQTNKHRKSHEVWAQEIIRISDIVLEILDARFVEETRHHEIEREILNKGKKLIYVINKADLVDAKALINSGKLKELKPYVLISCKKQIGRTKLRNMIKIEVKRMRKANADLMKKAEAGMLDISGEKKEIIIKADRRAHVGIIGYPNTGKSTLINILSGGGGANASSESGFTKGVQKIKFSKDILILDSPGLIPMKENLFVNLIDSNKHGKIGARTPNTVDKPEVVVSEIMKEYPDKIEKFYDIESMGDSEILFEKLGRKFGFLLKGNRPDIDKTARRILKDWQEGKIR